MTAGFLPYEFRFNAADNPHSREGLFKQCNDNKVPHNPMSYQNKKFYWTCQRGVKWPNDYIRLDSMMQWIIEKSQDY